MYVGYLSLPQSNQTARRERIPHQMMPRQCNAFAVLRRCQQAGQVGKERAVIAVGQCQARGLEP